VRFRKSWRTGSVEIYLEGDEKPPFGKLDPEDCIHPPSAWVYVEWRSEYLGHGYYCALCGKLMQVG